jgi:thiosulfate dehydrogenase
MIFRGFTIAVLNSVFLLSACARTSPLIPSDTALTTAWDFPRNPLTDPDLDNSRLSEDIRWGFRLFTDTSREAPQFSPGRMTCNNCHLNGGQRERSLPLVGIAGMFPEYNRRAGRLYSLSDRVVDCFMRSQNATGALAKGTGDGPWADQSELPTTKSREVLALVAYITWLAQGSELGKSPEWRGQNAIPAENRLPLDKLDPALGETLFMENCTNCHGEDGQGRAIGEKIAGPLWGPDSWNDGAGAARIYTLAGIIRYAMPFTNPGALTDEQAQHVAAFINSKPRPSYPFKHDDYLAENIPIDSVYYPKR